MAWTIQYIANTDRDKVGAVVATWTEPTGEVFVFTDEQVNTNNAGQKSTYVTKAKAALAKWQTDLNKAKSNTTAIETELTTLLNV
mgnify:CR=1 FL=1